jgi:hypothetical protein
MYFFLNKIPSIFIPYVDAIIENNMLFSFLAKIIEIFVIIVFLSLFRTYIHCIPSPYDNSFLHKAFQFLSPKPRSRPE